MGYWLLKLGKRKCLMQSFYTQCRDAMHCVSTIIIIISDAVLVSDKIIQNSELFEGNQFHIEDQGGTAGDHAACTLLAVCEVVGDKETVF